MKSFILISVYLLRIEDQSGDLLPLDRPEEAGCVAGMTRCAGLFHLIEEGVPSQSTSIRQTRCMWPLSSPFFQIFCLLLL